MISIFLKKINDQYGHPVGDIVLKNISALIKDNSRASDIVARYGGEEFVELLPETTLEQAMKLAEKIRLAIENLVIHTEDNTKIQVTASFGVSAYSPENCSDSINPEQIIKYADIALYKAKSNGRNQVENDSIQD